MVAEEARPAAGTPAATPARSGTASRHGTAWRAVAALCSGLAQLLALPPYGLWVIAPLSATLLLIAVRGVAPRRAAWLGALAGAALMVPLIRWQDVFGVDVWLVIAAAETVYFVPMAMGLALVVRLRNWVVWSSALWVAQELVRARFPLGGFPWGKLAFSQPDTPLTGYAAWGSSALVTFMVALSGALLAAAIFRVARTGRPDLATIGAVAGIVAVAATGAVLPRVAAPTVDHTVRAGIVQGNVPGVGEASILGERQEVLNNHVAATHQLASQVRSGEFAQPDLVILPENASDIDLYTDSGAAALVQDAADDVGAPLLIGATRYLDDGQREIRAVVWNPAEGAGEYYVKRYLVPFGEYVPFRDVFAPLVSRLQQVSSDAVPGSDPGALRLGDTTVATAICFDVAFDQPMREAVAAGGQLLVVPTNNANYNFTGQSEQQLAITQLRAVEHGRPALVAATSGISAVVGPDGTVTYRSPEAEAAVHVAEVPAMTGLTPATRVGALPEWGLALLGIGAVGFALLRRKAARS